MDEVEAVDVEGAVTGNSKDCEEARPSSAASRLSTSDCVEAVGPARRGRCVFVDKRGGDVDDGAFGEKDGNDVSDLLSSDVTLAALEPA